MLTFAEERPRVSLRAPGTLAMSLKERIGFLPMLDATRHT